jgi:molybdopterin synthase catalytic subunit
VEEAKEIPGVQQITFTKEVGDVATPIQCSNDRIGFVIAQGATAEDAVKACEKAMETIKIVIE